jgi:hypothetical protein
MNDINNTITGAIYSGDTDQIRQAKEVIDQFSRLDRETRDSWNVNNTVNTLADSNGIDQLNAALNSLIVIEERNGAALDRLIETTARNGDVKVIVE